MQWESPWGDARVKRVLAMMAPVTLGLGVYQVNVLVDSFLAMSVATWAPAALTYAQRLVYTPMSIFATALGTVLLPTFSQQAAREQHDEILTTMGVALRNVALVMIPMSVGLIVLAQPVVDLAFVWRDGLFRADSAQQTARAVWFMAPGLALFSAYKVLVPAFYALKDTATPVKIAVRVVFLNFALNVCFILTWPTGWKHAGIPFATVLASAANCMSLGVMLHRRLGSPGWGRIAGVAVRCLLASLLMGVVVYCVRLEMSPIVWGHGDKWAKLGQVVALLSAVLAGMAVYTGLMWLFCRTELKEMIGSRRRRESEERLS